MGFWSQRKWATSICFCHELGVSSFSLRWVIRRNPTSSGRSTFPLARDTSFKPMRALAAIRRRLPIFIFPKSMIPSPVFLDLLMWVS